MKTVALHDFINKAVSKADYLTSRLAVTTVLETDFRSHRFSVCSSPGFYSPQHSLPRLSSSIFPLPPPLHTFELCPEKSSYYDASYRLCEKSKSTTKAACVSPID